MDNQNIVDLLETEAKKREIWEDPLAEAYATDLSSIIDNIQKQVLAEASARIKKETSEKIMDTIDIDTVNITRDITKDIKDIKDISDIKTENLKQVIKQTVERAVESSVKTAVDAALTRFIDKLNLEHDKTLIKLYSHHQNQFDKYLQALTKSREANQLLRKEIARLEGV